MRWFYQPAIFLLVAAHAFAEPASNAIKEAPSRPSTEANIVIEDQEVLDTCAEDQICVQGRLYNDGAKPAAQVRIRVEVGAIRQGRPRAVVMQKVDHPTMAPGDRQEFSFAMNRRIPVKNAKGQERSIEMGRYNFRLVPVWVTPKPKPSLKSKAKRR